jgi:hypothetical protein
METKTYAESRPITQLSAAQLKRSLERVNRDRSAITDRLISLGRGHETPRQTMKLNDPVAVEFRMIAYKHQELIQERDARLKWHSNLKPIKIPVWLGTQTTLEWLRSQKHSVRNSNGTLLTPSTRED